MILKHVSFTFLFIVFLFSLNTYSADDLGGLENLLFPFNFTPNFTTSKKGTCQMGGACVCTDCKVCPECPTCPKCKKTVCPKCPDPLDECPDIPACPKCEVCKPCKRTICKVKQMPIPLIEPIKIKKHKPFKKFIYRDELMGQLFCFYRKDRARMTGYIEYLESMIKKYEQVIKKYNDAVKKKEFCSLIKRETTAILPPAEEDADLYMLEE